MNKNMRTRNLDPSKPMVVYDSTKDDLPDRIENNAMVRSSTLPTGMEKEEELEHHLQLALSAAQKYGDTKSVAIPVPDFVQIESDLYDRFYPTKKFTKPAELYRVQGLGVAPEPEAVDYCLDEADEEWLKQIAPMVISADSFEQAIDRLEKSTGAREPSEADSMKILRDPNDITGERYQKNVAVYKYWVAKRKKMGHPLIPRVRTENKRDAASGHDPYIAFRRRAEKMQTRKNRKSDEQNYAIMYKMKIAHTRTTKDGLLDILRSIHERELLKLRTTLMERHEFQLSTCLFDDGGGEYYSHILANYDELNRLDASEDTKAIENDQNDDLESDGETADDISEIADSDGTSSWSDVNPNEASRARSPLYHMDGNYKDMPAPLTVDPNLISEAEYRKTEGLDYLGPDGQFTFVPRKDCRYIEQTDCDNNEELDRAEDELNRYFLQEVPVILNGQTVMKTLLASRSFRFGGLRRLDYYKLPSEVSAMDLNKGQMGVQRDGDIASLSDHPDWNVFLNNQRIYKYCPEPVDKVDEPTRLPMSDELLEEIYQFALSWAPPPDPEAPTEDEVVSLYHVACSSLSQQLQEHNYFQPVIPHLMEWTAYTDGGPDIDMDEPHQSSQEGSMESENPTEQPKSLLDSAPPTPIHSEVESMTSFVTDTSQNAKKRKMPAKTPKSFADNIPSSNKKPRITKAASVGVTRKKGKGGEVQSENHNGFVAAAMSMPPALASPPQPPVIGILKKTTIRKTPPQKQEPVSVPPPKPSALMNGGKLNLVVSRG